MSGRKHAGLFHIPALLLLLDLGAGIATAETLPAGRLEEAYRSARAAVKSAGLSKPEEHTSRKATVTCDFRPVAKADSKEEYDALGKLEFKIDLDQTKVPVKCLSYECVLDGTEREIRLVSVLERPRRAAVFSDDPFAPLPRMVLYGDNGDDTDFMVVTNWYGEALLILMTDSNIAQSTEPVICKVELR